MNTITRRDFLKGTAATVVSFAALSTLGACASEETKEPEVSVEPETNEPEVKGPVDGKYVTKAMGHENWIYVATTLAGGKITSCKVLSHEETMGIGNYACSRIPTAIVANQSINVPNVRGASTSSRAIKDAVEAAIEAAGYNVDDFNKKVEIEQVGGSQDLECDVAIMGAGTAGLTAAARLLEKGKKVVIIEKNDIPGGSMPMTYGGIATAGSKLQRNFDVSGMYANSPYNSLELMMAFWTKYLNPELDTYNPEMPYMTQQYRVAGDVVDWMNEGGCGFNTMGSFEQGTAYGYTVYLAPGCYKGGAGYAMMWLENRVKALGGTIIYSTAVDAFLKDANGNITGLTALGNNGTRYNVTSKKTLLASGGFAKNAEMIKEYEPGYEGYFFNCCSGSTGEGTKMALAEGAFMECCGRLLPAFLSSNASKFELAFMHHSTPGIMVNSKGESLGNFLSDNHYAMARAKLNKDHGDKFYYIFDDASAETTKDFESYGFDGYKAIFEKGEAVRYNSLAECASTLGLAGLEAAVEANNKASLAGEADEYGRKNCPYIETRDGVWAIQVDPTFYLTTAGIHIDTACHVLKEDGSSIKNLYAAGDVCGSVEEKDGKKYGMGFDVALTYGWTAADTIAKEL